MAIPLTEYVNITSGVGGAAAASRRELVARFFTSNDTAVPSYDANGIAEYKKAATVAEEFGPNSLEYAVALKYFAFISKSVTAAKKISFAKWDPTVEEPNTALERVDGCNNNFGSFAFLDSLTPTQIGKVAAVNAGFNYRYLYSVPVTEDNADAIITAVSGASGTCFTLDSTSTYDASQVDQEGFPLREFAEYAPMVLFATTDYTKLNATKTYMYQKFSDLPDEVDNLTKKMRFDAFPCSNGKKYPVNYIGCTQQAGKLISFYQCGNNCDVETLETSVYCNEVWMKDAIATNLFNLMMALEKVPANDKGKTQCEMMVMSIVKEAVNNGTICPGKELTDVQKVYIESVTGDADAWKAVFSDGYWFTINISYDDALGKYKASYDLVYSKGDAVRYMEGRDIMI